MAYDQFDNTELVLRDKLAIDRTRLANERTVLAYLRTAFMLIIAGATAIKLFGDSSTAVATGWALVALGVAVALFGGWRFVAMRRTIQRATQA
jgi:putative membrane protein